MQVLSRFTSPEHDFTGTLAPHMNAFNSGDVPAVGTVIHGLPFKLTIILRVVELQVNALAGLNCSLHAMPLH